VSLKTIFMHLKQQINALIRFGDDDQEREVMIFIKLLLVYACFLGSFDLDD
jgi:hypothetical protein